MRLVAVEIENFRAYRERTRLAVGDLTTLIGRNDAGKSTWLEALDIFFKNKVCEIEKGDRNIHGEGSPVVIACEFSELPSAIVLDTSAETTLAKEFLVTQTGTLLVEKEFDCSKDSVPYEVYARALHPTVTGADNLLGLKERDLQTIVKERGLAVSLKGNPAMRQAIWSSFSDLEFAEVRVPLSKGKEDQKRVWEQIEPRLPKFALFQSDRRSRDSDGEVQNPLKDAIIAAIAEVQDEIDKIQRAVQKRAQEIADLTHEALYEIDPTLASTLTPRVEPPKTKQWANIFSIGVDTGGIPLNKRGSGVRRMILVAFFKAEAQRRLLSGEMPSIIYAVEEPETSQHPHNQRILIESFLALSQQSNCQILLTTHSPGLAAELPSESIRFISGGEAGATPTVQTGADVFGEVADALGVVPDSRVKVLICVEGPTDVIALKHLSRALHADDADLPNLFTDPRVAFVPLGGGSLKHWVTENYLRDLRLPEVHIYDGDQKQYGEKVKEVNARADGLESWAVQTKKHEIECYLHTDAIRAAYGVEVDIVDHPTPERPAVPKAFATAIKPIKNLKDLPNDNKAKQWLAKAFAQMTANMLSERDPTGEVRKWMENIKIIIER